MSVSAVHYSLAAVQSEVRQLLAAGTLRCSEPIKHLQAYFPEREWLPIQNELLLQDYTLSDAIVDLIAHEEWRED